jgi:hypothetical protein
MVDGVGECIRACFANLFGLDNRRGLLRKGSCLIHVKKVKGRILLYLFMVGVGDAFRNT